LPTPWKGVSVRRLTSLLGLGAVILLGFLGGRAVADQPHMIAARDHLRRARVELDRADADKGGHRVAALRRVDEAIAEVEAGIAYGAGQ
jgi:hypothetical protein